MKISNLLLLGFSFATLSQGSGGPCVVPGQGYFRIHVGTAGLFGGFAHEHLIQAEKIEGCINLDPAGPAHSSIKLVFTTADLHVLDPKESAKDRAQVQKTMETEVLRISEYPQVTFESTSVALAGASDRLRVHGNLTIRGKTLPVDIPLSFSRADGAEYRAIGKFSFKQTSFGIKPIQLAGGTVKVKDEVETEFELFLK